MSTEKKDLGAILRDNLPVYETPRSLREWVHEQAPDDDANTPTPIAPRRSTIAARPYLYAAGILIAFLGGWVANRSIGSRLEESANREVLVAELVDNHVRSLVGDHLTDVKSTDQHTVKPWFAGRTDFAPRVVDLTAQGFPLIGGRVDYIRGRTTAALVYGRRRHVVNLFIWPASASDAGELTRQYKGYSLLHWEAAGLSYWAVTDAAAVDLEAFRHAYDAGG